MFTTRQDIERAEVKLHAVADTGTNHVHTRDMAGPHVHAAATPSGGSSPTEIAGPEASQDVPLRYPVNILISYYYFQNDDIADIASWGMRILADSGAFSAATRDAQVDLDAYADWIKRWRDSIYWAASLDVIGDHQATVENWHYLRDQGAETVPTIHFPADPEMMDVFVNEGADLIGLGGMVPRSSQPDLLLRWSLAAFRYARDHHPHVRFHGWGINHKRLLMSLPWFSVDSSGFASAYRYARMQLFDPDAARFRIVDISRGSSEMAAHNRLLRDHYGIEWQRVTESTPETRRDVTRVAVRSLQLVEDFLAERWPDLTPPASLDGGGPKLHAVMGTPQMQPAKSLNPADTPPKGAT